MDKNIKKEEATAIDSSLSLILNSIIPQDDNNVNSLISEDLKLGYNYADVKSQITLNYSHLNGTKISTKRFVAILCKLFKIKAEISYIGKNKMITYYKFNNYLDICQPYNLIDLGYDLNMISSALEHKGSDVKTITENVKYYLDTSNFNYIGIDKFNLAPDYLIKFTNGIFNLKTKEFYDKKSKEYQAIITHYDFVNAFEFNYLENLSENNQYILVYNKLIKDLANNKEDQILLFNQLVSAVIEGNGRGKYIMLSGQAGSGKTTFGNVLLNIAGENYTSYLTMDSFDDDNKINMIDMSTRLILGDDLQKSAKLVGKSLRYFKTLVDGNKLSVAVKYEPNRIVQTNGLWLQMMNDDPSIYEANDAIKDRTILVNIEGRNHRNVTDPAEKEFSKRLDKYTGKFGKADEQFIQAVVSHIVQTVEYFDEFTISEEMRKATEEMVDDASWAKQFTDWLDDYGIFNFSYLSSSDLKDLVYYWSNKNNPQMGKPSAKTIKKELEPYLNKYRYKYDSNVKRPSSISKLDYNQDLISELFDNKISFESSMVRYWISNDKISKSEVDKLINTIKSNDNNLLYKELSFKEKIIVNYASDFDSDILEWSISTM